MATFLTSGSNRDDSGSAITDLDTAATMNITSGSCLICWCKWEGANGSTVSFKKNDGTNTFTMRPTVDHPATNDMHCAWGYLLTHSMSGATTFRMSLSLARAFVKFIVMEFSYSGAIAFDTDTITTNTTVAITTMPISTRPLEAIVCGGYAEYSAEDAVSPKIFGVAADGAVEAGGTGFTQMWYRLLSGEGAGMATANDLASGSNHSTGIIAIKIGTEAKKNTPIMYRGQA